MPTSEPATGDELMIVEAARGLPDGAVCFVGIGLPSAAANLARYSSLIGVVTTMKVRSPSPVFWMECRTPGGRKER